MKRTFQPNNRRRHMKHGFRQRMRTRAGRAVLKRRRRVSREDIVVHYLVHDDAIIDDSAAMRGRRVGLAVSKAVGNAVTRNAVKRRFRVLARKYESALPESCDIVLRAKPSAAHADFLSLEQQIAACFEAVNRKAVRR